MNVLLVMEDVNKYVQIMFLFSLALAILVSDFIMSSFAQVYIISFFNNSIESTLDIDECSDGINNCNQLCINTFGSYLCNCQTGYKLNSDNYTCIGMIFGINTYNMCYTLYRY